MSVLLPNSTPRITRRNFILGTGVAAAGLTLYAGEIARHEIDIVQRPIAIRDLPDAFHGFRIAQISDIHLDEFTEPWFLERVIRHVNDLKPDLVLITGDYITLGAFSFIAIRHALHRCAELLTNLTCPMRYGVLGNHDTAVGAPMVIDALQSTGTPILHDSYLAIERNGAHLWIAGTTDPATTIPKLDRALPERPDGPVILMAHAPDFADNVLAHPRGKHVDLMLSGHTHGGQIRLPFLGPTVLPPVGRKYAEGHYQFDRMQLYVNRGIGTVGLPFRFNCPPEITVLTLNAG